MIGASCCCHVTLLILLLVLRLTFADINTPSISSSSSFSSSSSLLTLSYSFPQSSSLASSSTSSKVTTPTFRIPSETLGRTSPQATNTFSESQSNALLVSNDQSGHKTSLETPPIRIDSQSNTLSSYSNDQLQHEAPPLNLKPPIIPSSVVMQTILSSPAVDHAPQSTQSKTVTISKRAKFKLTASSKDKQRLLAIEQLFLKNVGLLRRPQIEADYAVPEYMLKLYHSQVDGSNDNQRYLQVKGNGAIAANTVRSFVHTDADSSSCKPPLCSRVHFDIGTIPEEETIAGAEFRIFVDTTPDTWAKDNARTSSEPQSGAVEAVQRSVPRRESLFRLEVHEIMRPDSANGDVISRLLDTRVVSHGNSTWHSFDIRPAVLRWKRGDSHNYGLEVRLLAKAPNIQTDNHVRLRRSAFLQDRQWALQRPLLVTYTNDGLSPYSTSTSPLSSTSTRLTRLKRRRRQTSDEDHKNNKRNRRKKNKKRRKKKGNKNICKKHGLYVNFNDVGWDDWIVAPPGYSAYYCHGDCMAPLPHFTKASNHAMLQARVYKVDPSSVPMVCCVPSKMTPISMLYRDEKGRTVLKNYQDMTVVECSCK